MKDKILKALSILLAITGAVTSLEMVPFLPEAWGVPLVAVAAALSALITRVGDLLDDGKLNQSFGTPRARK